MQTNTVAMPARETFRPMPAIKPPKASQEKPKPRDALTVDFICMALRQAGIVTDEMIAAIKSREQDQLGMLHKQYGKNSTTQITAVDVISSMGLRLPANNAQALTDELIMKTLADYWKLPFLKIDLSTLNSNKIAANLSEPFARKHLIVPVLVSKTMLLVALINPMDAEALQIVQHAAKLKVRPVISTKADVLRAIERCYAERRTQETVEKNRNDFRAFIRAAMKDLPDGGYSKEDPIIRPGDTGQYEEKHIVNAVNSLLHYAVEQRASDIHIEPKRAHSAIRLRIDGFLHEFDRIPLEVHQSFALRMKALAGMHIAEKRKPLDGSFQAKFRNQEFEFRISTMPVAFGEKVMIRPSNQNLLLQRVEDLGFSKGELAIFRAMLAHNNGMILVTGPTGSGKTTTLYSTLNALAERAINITTIEDPIELLYEKFNQIAVQPNAGLTFGTAIKHIVRQAADVIMIGEIRDQETAENAFKAALSGHLVISTLHTNDAPSAIIRLTDMGVQTSLIESALVGVMSQRLVRKVCEMCGEPYRPAQAELQALGLTEEELVGLPIRKGFGCSHCRGTGYAGRTAIFEMMPITDGVKLLAHDHMAAHLIRKAAAKEGMRTLLDSAMEKFKAGVTTSEEVLRILGGVDVDAVGE